MNLDKIRVAVRPRSASEAMDLGFVMARHWWRPLLISWLIVALPMFIILHALCYQLPWLAGLLFWLCKPLYEQAPLYLLSRALFSEKTSMREIVKNIRQIAGKQIFANLTWRRLSPRRSFNAPVNQLEGLNGETRRKRIAVLHGNKPSGGWLTIICAHFEILLYLSLFALLAILIPPETEIETLRLFTEDSFWPVVIQNSLYLFAIAIIAPFYIAAGFSLYLHRRIELEAWDIELDFRKLKQRLASPIKTTGLASIIMLCTLLSGLLPDNSLAADTIEPGPVLTKELAHQQIKEILNDEVFGHEETRNVWRKKSEPVDPQSLNLPDLSWLQKIGQFIAFAGEILMWIALGLLLIWIAYHYPTWSRWFGLKGITRKKTYLPPETLFGLDLRPESLPNDIPGEAWRLYQQNQIRTALSLLYRATLISLMKQHQIEFHSSSTEGECLGIVNKKQLHELGDYFRNLTRVWQTMAYGHNAPTLTQMQQLCDGWRRHFGENNAAAG